MKIHQNQSHFSSIKNKNESFFEKQKSFRSILIDTFRAYFDNLEHATQGFEENWVFSAFEDK